MIKKTIRLPLIPPSFLFLIFENEGEEHANVSLAMAELNYGAMVAESIDGNLGMFFKPYLGYTTIGTITHETEHLLDKLEQAIGQESGRMNEYRAYLIEFIVDKVIKEFVKHGYELYPIIQKKNGSKN